MLAINSVRMSCRALFGLDFPIFGVPPCSVCTLCLIPPFMSPRTTLLCFSIALIWWQLHDVIDIYLIGGCNKLTKCKCFSRKWNVTRALHTLLWLARYNQYYEWRVDCSYLHRNCWWFDGIVTQSEMIFTYSHTHILYLFIVFWWCSKWIG